jgi:hypothetical protein
MLNQKGALATVGPLTCFVCLTPYDQGMATQTLSTVLNAYAVEAQPSVGAGRYVDPKHGSV